MNRWLRLGVFVATLLSLTGALAFAHGDKDGSLSCRDNWSSDRLVGQCEIREQKVPATGMLTVDARRNGGVSIKGWDQNEVLVRARVQAAAGTQSEADQLGLSYMARAGFDPREAVTFWERMGKQGGNQPPEFMSTHPSHGTRIQRLKELLPQATQEYQRALGGNTSKELERAP